MQEGDYNFYDNWRNLLGFHRSVYDLADWLRFNPESVFWEEYPDGYKGERGEECMKLLFKQRMFSWFDSYDIYDEGGKTLYTVKGELSWGHCLRIFDQNGNELGMVKERVLTFLPLFEIYMNGQLAGTIKKEFTFFTPAFEIDFMHWHVEGDFFEWDYRIMAKNGQQVASVSKQLFNLTDTYIIDVAEAKDALGALMLVLAIDAEKCSRND